VAHSITRRHNRAALFAGLFIVAVGVIRFPADDFRLEMQALFQVASVLLLCVILWNVNKWMSLFLLLCLVSMFYPFYTRHSFLAFQDVFYAFVWFTLLTLCLRRSHYHYILSGICLVALANVAFLILQYFNLDPIFKAVNGSPEDPVVGLMGNRNFVSALLAFSFPAFLRPRWVWCIPALFLGLVLAKSTGGPLALAAGWMFYSVLRGRAIFPLLAVALGLLLFVAFVDKPNFFGGRLEAWKNALGYYQQHWLMGCGLGHWKIVFKRIMLQGNRFWWTHAHNEIIQGLFEMGVGFAIVLTGYIYDTARKYKREALVPATALIIIFINSLVNFPFHIATTAMLAVTWMALYDIEVAHE